MRSEYERAMDSADALRIEREQARDTLAKLRAELDAAKRTLAAVRAAQTWIQVEDAIKDYDAAAKTSGDGGTSSGRASSRRCSTPAGGSEEAGTSAPQPDDERRAREWLKHQPTYPKSVVSLAALLREVRAEGERAGWDLAVTMLRDAAESNDEYATAEWLAARRPGRQGGGDGGGA